MKKESREKPNAIRRFSFINWIKKIEVNKPKTILEIFISIGLIAYLTYQQTKISRQQLVISQQQQKIMDFDYKVNVYEHSPKFNFITIPTQEDSTGHCLTEEIIIENKGYPIKESNIEIYSFIEVEIDSVINNDLKKIKTKIVPIDLYYSVGRISEEEKGVLATYSHLYNCKTYFDTQNEFQNHAETYYWTTRRFNLVEVGYVNFMGEKDTTIYATIS